MSQLRQGILSVVGPVSGIALSCIALGVLWIGTPWPAQFLMCIPFFIAAYAITRLKADGRFVLLGAAPVALLVVQFRDKEGSHAAPVLLVCAWAASILLGWHFARRRDNPTSK